MQYTGCSKCAQQTDANVPTNQTADEQTELLSDKVASFASALIVTYKAANASNDLRAKQGANETHAKTIISANVCSTKPQSFSVTFRPSDDTLAYW